jgi:hypothetical protein
VGRVRRGGSGEVRQQFALRPALLFELLRSMILIIENSCRERSGAVDADVCEQSCEQVVCTSRAYETDDTAVTSFVGHVEDGLVTLDGECWVFSP